MWQDFLNALALVFVIEGIMPFLAPKKWQEMMRQATDLDPANMRWFGFISMLIGVVLLYLLK